MGVDNVAVDPLRSFRCSANSDELKRNFLDALEHWGVKYCVALAVSWQADGAPIGSVIVESLPVSHSFERTSQRRPQTMALLADVLEGAEPVEIDVISVQGLGEEWREGFAEAREALAFECCLIVPVFRENQLRGIGIYMAERRLEGAAIELLTVLSDVGYDKVESLGLLPPPPSPLSQRQRDVLAHCAEGRSDWEIAQLLGISAVTAHEHVESAKRKLGVRTRVQAAIVAAQNGWI